MKHVICVLAVALTTASFTQTNPAFGLEACYPLDSGSFVNMGPNNPGLNGTINGNVVSATGHNGSPNSALNFGGTVSDYVRISASPHPLKPSPALSFSGWFRMSSLNGGYFLWVDNGNFVNNIEAYALGITSANQFIAVKRNGSNSALATSPAAVIANTWYHVAFTCDQSNLTIYVNGVPTSVSANFAFNYASGDVYLGGTAGSAANSSYNDPWAGDMDNLRFYSRVLSASEVTNLYLNDPVCTATTCGTCTQTPVPCCLGNDCGGAINALTKDWMISTAGNDFTFPDDGALTDKLNLGYNCGAQTIGKLSSFTNKQTNASPANGVSPFSNAVFGHSSIGNDNLATGVMGVGENFSAQADAYGIWGRAVVDGHFGIGVRGTSENGSSGTNYGGSFFAQSAAFNIGVEGVAVPSNGNPSPETFRTNWPAGANIGVYGSCSAPNPAQQGAPQTADWAGYFDGDVKVVGNVFSTINLFSSDKRFKSDVRELENVSEKISKLNSYTYKFKTEEFENRRFPTGEQIGFVAQELKEVFPQLVQEDKQGYLAVNYNGFIPVLLQAIKEQQKKIEEQQTQIDDLKNLYAHHETAEKSNNAVVSGVVQLSDKNALVLKQNVPNPFAESTTISYNIPETFSKAQILFTTNDGMIIRAYDIPRSGAGELQVFADDLSNGLYSYSLVIDGKTIQTKKMLKQ